MTSVKPIKTDLVVKTWDMDINDENATLILSKATLFWIYGPLFCLCIEHGSSLPHVQTLYYVYNHIHLFSLNFQIINFWGTGIVE